MNTTAIGASHERAAANYLEDLGMYIIERNWRTKWCEIDIVARDSDGVIHIVEVRYRKASGSGNSIDSVTPAKQKQLLHATKRWLMMRGALHGIQIDVIGITGNSVEYIADAVQEF